MGDVIQQLASVPGVVGSLVYGHRGEILASEFPPLFEPSTLQRATRLLAEDRVVLGNMMGATASLDLRYSGGRAVVKLADARERLQRALVGQIGPIGEFVFEQAWAEWAASGSPTLPGLAKLVSALGREIE